MGRGYFITGTDTNIGKTVVTAGLLAGFHNRGIKTAVFKPVVSGAMIKDGQLVSQDIQFYLCTAQIDQLPKEICCYCFEPPVSPHLAAKMAGVKIRLSVIKQAFQHLTTMNQMVLVEGAGGLAVPVTGADFTMADLARELRIPLILVTRPGLGTINHTVLTVEYAKGSGIAVKGIVVNGCPAEGLNQMEEDNVEMIKQMTGVPILGLLPRVNGLSVEESRPGNLIEVVSKQIDWHYLMA